MCQLRSELDLLNIFSVNDQVIPPIKGYSYFQNAANYPFEFEQTQYSNINAWWMAEFSALIYEEKVFVAETMSNLGCSHVRWLENMTTHTQGVVVSFDNFIVVAFRGTEFPKPLQVPNAKVSKAFLADFIYTDANISKSNLRGTGVHKGIHNALNSIWQELSLILVKTIQPIWFTGHSLGGALSLLAAYKWKGQSNNIEQNDQLLSTIGGIYTIGCPVIGDSKFKQLYDEELGQRTFHHVHGSDIVSNVENRFSSSVLSMLDYKQVGQALSIPRQNNNIFQNTNIFQYLYLVAFMPLIDHGPIFYLNFLWNQMIHCYPDK